MSICKRTVFGVLLAAASLFFAPLPASAADAGWIVVRSEGVVRVVGAGDMQPVSLSTALPSGSVITTGGDGYAMLRRGSQQIVVSPNSRMSLPAEQRAGFTRIVQDLGTVMFKVDRRETPHFEVDTPIVAAVVKGTTFTVTSNATGDTVHVVEGLVEVRTHRGAAVADVPAGSTVFVSRNEPDVIVFERAAGGDAAPLQKTEKLDLDNTRRASLSDERVTVASAIGAEPLDLAGLTDGLVATGGSRQTVPTIQAGGALLNGAVTASLDAGAGGVSTSAGVTVADTSLSADLGLGGGSVSAGVDASVGGAVAAGVDVGVGGGSLSAGLDAGVGGSSGLGVSGGVDLGGGGATAGLDVGLGGTSGIGVGADLGVGGGGATAGLDVGLGGAGVGADISLGGGGGLDVGLTVGGVTVGLGGSGSGSGGGSGSGSGGSGGGLLGGLLGGG